jgi:preprotein translocase subunit Sss1
LLDRGMGRRAGRTIAPTRTEAQMVALVALVLILAIFGGLGFAVHVLWYVLILAILLWLIGFFIGGVPDGGGRRWYGR